MLDRLLEYWPLIALALLTVSSILNAATEHWSEREGLTKWLLFLSEAFSILASRGVPQRVKPPLSSRPPTKGGNSGA